MATRTVYITVRIDIDNPDVASITDDDVRYIVNETEYSFANVENFNLETEIFDLNY